jgi:HAD superfamily hydrolase (TIGR01509 family)
MPEFDAILFDFDGVLLDSEPVHCDCWREALAPLGVPITWEVYAAHCVGAADREMIHVFAKLVDPPADPAKLWEQYPRKKQLFQERIAVAPPFAEGVADFFRELAGRYKLGVVSSSARAEVEPLLALMGILPYLSTTVCGGDVQRHKPDPEPYLLAAQRLGIHRALVVEDSPPGMESARAAGFEAMRISNPALMMQMVRARLNGSGRPPGRTEPRP